MREDLVDSVSFDNALRETGAEYGVLVPREIFKRLVSGGEKPLKMWWE
ncbi:MAG: hypothetical protein ACI8Z1_002749 [Candidatus Azotimanducaceae bacterium]